MIEWLFTRSSAQGQLRSMTASIDTILKTRAKQKGVRKRRKGTKSEKEEEEEEEEEEGEEKQEDEPLRRVRVGVTCRQGAQLSPCFVERLFQHYETSTLWENLVVKRFHWDALSGAWGRNKDFVWQQKTVPAQYLEDMRDVAIDEMWTPFPGSVNSEIESAFSQDPFCHKFQYQDYSFDFEAGLVYNKIRRNSYPFRCNVTLLDSRVNCWHLQHEGYVSCSDSYRAAGVLPYSMHPTSGTAVFLLGKITYECGEWCDFGGLRSFRYCHPYLNLPCLTPSLPPFPREKPRFTAARECWEETFGILGSFRQLSTSLKDFTANNVFKV